MSIAIAPARARSPWERAYRIATIAAAVQFGWVFFMGLLAGGQFLADEWPRWDPLAEWPVLAVPAWLTIAIGAVAAAAAIAMAVRREVTDEVGVAFQDLATGVLLLGLLPVGLARAYAGVGVPDGALGWHWIASLVFVVTLLALVVRVVRASRASRAPRAGRSS
ncbi:hypothetical protein [Agrococcus sp. Marseille-Q4369]|uniref:hypothetical protein n=1 Tax=Agrococcus sp. Marseille-Q4369 TaxID=2810513 RepID=UPI001B8CD07A|nr:hypothetical protein [Agrococcus sp. Marseille-Q4369]QUW17918.1 hypothetical protein JSQ78_08585 [Agrococcus sp. Marseille-Q4369]